MGNIPTGKIRITKPDDMPQRLYLVVSERLEDYSLTEDTYCIAELVIAGSRSQARYLAWKTDPYSFSSDIRCMPRFRVESKSVPVSGPARIVSNEPEYKHSDCWIFADKVERVRA